jgi:DNA-binding NarL/FixJ family response regulator
MTWQRRPQDEVTVSRPQKSSLPVVGRRNEREALAALLDAAVSGRGGTAVLEGEAGSGKTTVVEELAGTADGLGVQVLRGSARELEQERPFGCVHEALAAHPDPSTADAGALQALLDRSGDRGEDARFAVLDEIADLVERWCAAGSVLIVLEDLHWGDPSSTLVLARLARLAPALPLAVVASLRPAPRPEHLALALAAAADAGASVLRLEPLDDKEVHELATRALGRPPGPAEVARLAETGGNALFVVELLRAAESDEAAAEAGPSLPPSLRLTLLRRVSALPGPTVDVLRIASILGSAFSVLDLALLLGRAHAETVRDLLPALDAGLLQDADAGRLRFRHDLVREAVYQDLPSSLRTSLHAQAARLLSQAGAAPIDVAQHVVLGAVPGDPGAVDLLVTAAQQCRATAPPVAVELLERALELVDPLSGRDVTVQAELALALRAAGRSTAAAQQAQLALASTQLPPTTRYTLVQALCEAMVFQGRTDELVRTAESALQSATTPSADRAVYAGYLWVVRALWRGEDPSLFADVAPADADVPEADDFIRCFVCLGRAFGSLRSGDLDGAEEHLHAALEVAERARLWREVVQVRSQRAFLLGCQDRVDEALEEAAAARRVATRVGPHSASAVTVLPWFWSGAWDELMTELDVREQVAAEAGVEPGASERAIRAYLLLRAGDSTAEDHLAHAERLLSERGAHGAVHFATWTRALLTERQQGPAAGLAALAPAVLARRSDLLFLRLVGPDAVRLALEARERATAEQMSALLDDVASRLGTVTARAVALHARARVSDDNALLEEALALLVETPARPDERAAVLAHVAGRVRRADPARADVLMDEAVAIWRRLGAHADADRHTRPSRTRARPVVGWESLTEGERRVVELLARGLRNKQIAAELFLSPRTVETHVSRALQKLQASSRVELAATALAHLR